MVLIDTVLGERGEEEGNCKQHKGGSGRWLELPVLTLQRCDGVMLCIAFNAVHWCALESTMTVALAQYW